MRVTALRCALRHTLGRRGLQSSRCEDTSVAAVNAWLAEPPSKPTWTIAGACAAHDVFDLNADVVVAVDEGDEPCEPWVAATRIAVPQPPVALGSAAADALPDELADEALLAMAPERLTFALCGVGTAETVFERLESLFPGARAVACARRRRRPSRGEERRGAGAGAARARAGGVLGLSGLRICAMAWRFHAIDATLSPWPRRAMALARNISNVTHRRPRIGPFEPTRRPRGRSSCRRARPV